MALGTISVKNFAEVRKADTTLICPTCQEKPEYHSGYKCPKCARAHKMYES